MTTLHQKLSKSHPKLTRGIVWCKRCGRSQHVDSAVCLARGWPKCCNETMTIDSPAEWKGTGEEVTPHPRPTPAERTER